MKIRYLTWQDFDDAVQTMANYFKGRHIKAIYGQPRGGMPIAVALSHATKIPLLHYNGGYNHPHTLWVDDIIDTKKTFNDIESAFGHKACWIAREKAQYMEYFAVDTMQSDWIVFPWEDKQNAKEDFESYKLSRQ